MKILVFTEGTVLMPKIALGVDREERVRQSMENLPSVNDFKTYVVNGGAVTKLQGWKKQGANIYYLTSRTSSSEIEDIRLVLVQNGFPQTDHLLFRVDGLEYADVAEKLMPEIFVEDDCESIGGIKEMTYPHMSQEAKRKVHSVVVNEFEGIDRLPSDIQQLLTI